MSSLLHTFICANFYSISGFFVHFAWCHFYYYNYIFTMILMWNCLCACFSLPLLLLLLVLMTVNVGFCDMALDMIYRNSKEAHYHDLRMRAYKNAMDKNINTWAKGANEYEWCSLQVVLFPLTCFVSHCSFIWQFGGAVVVVFVACERLCRYYISFWIRTQGKKIKARTDSRYEQPQQQQQQQIKKHIDTKRNNIIQTTKLLFLRTTCIPLSAASRRFFYINLFITRMKPIYIHA